MHVVQILNMEPGYVEETHFQALLRLQMVCICENHLKPLYISLFMYMSSTYGHYAASVGYTSRCLFDTGDLFL